MTLTATIRYPYDERIEQLFAAEVKVFPRTAYSLSKDGSDLLFSITADDATALRSATTTITKVLSVWESSLTHGR